MRSRARVIAAVSAGAIVGALAGFAFYFFRPPPYVSTIAVGFEESRSLKLRYLAHTALSRPELTALINRERLYAKELRELPMEDVVERMRRDIDFEVTGGDGEPALLRIGFLYEERGTAERVTRTLMNVAAGGPVPLQAQDVQCTERGSEGWRRLLTSDGPPRVQCTGAMSIGAGLRPQSEFDPFRRALLDREVLMAPISHMDAFRPYRESGNPEEAIRSVRGRLRFGPGENSEELRVSCSGRSPLEARDLLNGIIGPAVVKNARSGNPSVAVIDPPSLPTEPETSPWVAMIGVGAAAGALVGLLCLWTIPGNPVQEKMER